MPDKRTIQKATRDLRRGKSPSTAAGEFVREEIEHIREGKHGARSASQAIAIGLSKARRAGVPLKPPRRGQTSERTRRSAESAYEVGQGRRKPGPKSARRSRAMKEKLKREPRRTVSHQALSRHAKSVARRRGLAARAESARRAVATKRRQGTLKVAAKRAAATRRKHTKGRSHKKQSKRN